MPFPDYEFINYTYNMLIHDEMAYDRETLEQDLERYLSTMTIEQRSVYDQIIDVVSVDAAAVHARGDIVINVASSGIAALLLTDGRTTHSRFAIPINVLEDSFCNIQPDSELAALLNKAKLIIWDEAPMMHRHCFEAFDRTMRDIIKSANKKMPFGGKFVVFGGDFRQILPVVHKRNRAEIVNASLHSSDLWHHCKVLTLTKNMRLNGGENELEKKEISDFADWILKIGEGKINLPNDGEADIIFPDEVLIPSHDNHIQNIVDSIYPSLHSDLGDPNFFQNKAILAPTNEEVDSINDAVLASIDEEERVYYSSDSLSPDEVDDLFAQ
ncbi:ATP-dependent DNA helicase RRM3-like [Rutidosis leptorrhynchoides]|uniref:ATP-dependent DNA helicase RRM3-like n=1 Tax=Rutidosis leptorrhynchoides TaxID=125765 RepID=UPI003A9A3654